MHEYSDNGECCVYCDLPIVDEPGREVLGRVMHAACEVAFQEEVEDVRDGAAIAA